MPSSSKWLFPLKWIESNVCRFFNSISTSKYSVLFEVLFWLGLFSLVSKSVFVTKFASVNLASKTPAAKLLTSGLAIHLSWLWSVRFFSISVTFVL